MSTNHTPNYSLCQWEGADKVIRADFNADNAKIDAALAGLSGALAEKPWKCVIYRESNGNSYPSSQQIYSIQSVDWATHDIVFLHVFYPEVEAYQSCPLSISLDTDKIMDTTVQDFLFVLFPMRNPERKAQGVLLCSETKVFRLDRPFNKLMSVSLRAPDRGSFPGYTFFGLG